MYRLHHNNLVKKMSNSQVETQKSHILMLERRIEKLEAIIDDFMSNWGPEVQKKRDRRDQVWDEMVRVVSLQKRETHKS